MPPTASSILGSSESIVSGESRQNTSTLYILLALIICLLIGGVAFGMIWWTHEKALKAETVEKDETIRLLKIQIAKFISEREIFMQRQAEELTMKFGLS